MPNVEGEEPYWGIKLRAIETQRLSRGATYEPIEMPGNSPTGFITAFFATFTGFALIWHIWWLVALGLVAAYAVFVGFAWRDAAEYSIPAEEVARSIATAGERASNGSPSRRRTAGMSATYTSPSAPVTPPGRAGARDWASTGGRPRLRDARGHGEGGPATSG